MRCPLDEHAVAPTDRFYSTRVRQLIRLELPEAEAQQLWAEVGRHRRDLERRLQRDIGQRVALLDYVLNIRPRLAEPQIVERRTLETLERQALSDTVTRLFNRHYFSAELTREVERCRRYGAITSLLLMDIDRFKSVNDGHGHAMGDEVLQRVGELVMKHVRGVDVPARLGGDEFAVILPDTAAADAFTVADRIRRDIAGTFGASPVNGRALRVTVSGGIGMFDAAGSTADALLEAADRRLYDAKRAGGNRIARAAGRPGAPTRAPGGVPFMP